MLLPSSTSSASRTSLVYITIGALIMIWTGVWYIYLFNNAPEHNTAYYWCTGFGVTGVALVVIGLGVGRIGTSPRQADLPHVVAPPAVMTDANGQPIAVVPASTAAARVLTTSAPAPAEVQQLPPARQQSAIPAIEGNRRS